MKNIERAHLKKAVKILKKDLPKKDECKTFAFGCPQCAMYTLLREFESYVNFFISTDEEMAAWDKREKQKSVKKK